MIIWKKREEWKGKENEGRGNYFSIFRFLSEKCIRTIFFYLRVKIGFCSI